MKSFSDLSSKLVESVLKMTIGGPYQTETGSKSGSQGDRNFEDLDSERSRILSIGKRNRRPVKTLLSVGGSGPCRRLRLQEWAILANTSPSPFLLR